MNGEGSKVFSTREGSKGLPKMQNWTGDKESIRTLRGMCANGGIQEVFRMYATLYTGQATATKLREMRRK
jgi:hypothetical protein